MGLIKDRSSYMKGTRRRTPPKCSVRVNYMARVFQKIHFKDCSSIFAITPTSRFSIKLSTSKRVLPRLLRKGENLSQNTFPFRKAMTLQSDES